MEQQHTPHRQKNGCKGPLLALLLGLAELGAFWYFRRSIAAMNWFIQYVSMPYKRVLSALVDPLPFSFCELAATLAILACLILLGRCVWLAVRRHVFRFGTWALHTATVVLWICAAVCALWGTQYYAPGFARRAGMKTPPLSVD